MIYLHDSILAHRYATFLCSWDVEIRGRHRQLDDSLVGQLTNSILQLNAEKMVASFQNHHLKFTEL